MPVRLLARLLAHVRADLAAQVRDGLGAMRRALAAAWQHRPTATRGAALLLSVALGLLGAWSVVAQARLPSRLPSALDWRAAAALLERDARPGDAVALEPAWLDRARELLPASLPILALRRYQGELLPGIRRIWLLSATDAPLVRWDAELDLGRRATRVDTQQLGALEVIRFDLAEPLLPLAVLADLGGDGAAMREVGGRPRRCLVLTPTPGAPLVHRFTATPFGHGLAGQAALLPGGATAPVRLSFQAAGRELGSLELLAADGWIPFRIDTGGLAASNQDLDVVVTAAGPAGRPICLEALVLP